MKNFMKLTAMLLAAVMLFATVEPAAVRAEDWRESSGTNDGRIDTNYGVIDENRGDVEYNRGTICDNRGLVHQNYELVTVNRGSVGANEGCVTTNYDDVARNERLVESNHGSIATNTHFACPFSLDTMNEGNASSWDEGVRVNETDGEIDANEGAVRINHGTIGKNMGFIQQNMGGTVTLNRADGIVYKTGAGGKVVNNFGTVENFTDVGTIENQYAGNVGDRYVISNTITNYFGGTIGNISVTNNFADITDVVTGAAVTAPNQYRAVNFVADSMEISFGDGFTAKTLMNEDGSDGDTLHFIKLGDDAGSGTITLTLADIYRNDHLIFKSGANSGTVTGDGYSFNYSLTYPDSTSVAISITGYAGNSCNLNPEMFGIYVVDEDARLVVYRLNPSEDELSFDTFTEWNDLFDYSGGLTEITLCFYYEYVPLVNSDFTATVVSSDDANGQTLCELGELIDPVLTGTASEVATGASIKVIPGGLANLVNSDTVYLKVDFNGATYYRTLRVPFETTEPGPQPGGGGSSGGGSSSGSDSNTVTTTNADGSKTTITTTKFADDSIETKKVTTRPDGSKIVDVLTEFPDGHYTQEIVTTYTDGTQDTTEIVFWNNSDYTSKNTEIKYADGKTVSKTENEYNNGDYDYRENVRQDGKLIETHTHYSKTADDGTIKKKDYDKDADGKESFKGKAYADGSSDASHVVVDYAANTREETTTTKAVDGKEITTYICEAYRSSKDTDVSVKPVKEMTVETDENGKTTLLSLDMAGSVMMEAATDPELAKRIDEATDGELNMENPTVADANEKIQQEQQEADKVTQEIQDEVAKQEEESHSPSLIWDEDTENDYQNHLDAYDWTDNDDMNHPSDEALYASYGIAVIPDSITTADERELAINTLGTGSLEDVAANEKVDCIVVGSNVTTIEENVLGKSKLDRIVFSSTKSLVFKPSALKGSKLKTIVLNSTGNKFKKNCLKGTSKKVVIKAPTAKEAKRVRKQLKKAGNKAATVEVTGSTDD